MSINDHPQGFAVLERQVNGQSITTVLAEIEELSAVAVPDICAVISPDINALANLLALIRKAVKEMQDAAMYVEDELVKVMPGKQHEVPGLGVIEMHTGASRKAWDKVGLMDVMAHAVSDKVPDAIVPETGEVLNAVQVTRDVLTAFTAAATPSWKVTGLRALGIDPEEYCETSWGRKTIQTPALKSTYGDEPVAAGD